MGPLPQGVAPPQFRSGTIPEESKWGLLQDHVPKARVYWIP